jgi:H+/Cl- antiporter ClcA/CBS domain-containing protein
MQGEIPNYEVATMEDIEMQQIAQEAVAIDDNESVEEVVERVPDAKDIKTVQLGYNILILLFLVGIASGLINGCVQWLVSLMSKGQAQLLMIGPVGPFYFLLTTTACAALSAFIIKVGAEGGTTGAGMAEVKALLVSDFHPTEFPKLVSIKIMILRICSLVCAAGGGLSVGLAAPLTHSTVCFAYTLMKFVPDFGELIDNPSMLKQIFAASAAVGFTSVANTPVGGLLFSIEVTSAYYLISNYWRSFMAATAGAVVYDMVMIAREEEGRFLDMPTVADPYTKVEYLMFGLLGLVCGLLGLGYLKVHQAWFLFAKPYTMKHPVATAAAVGAFTALMIYGLGMYSADGVTPTVTIRDCFTNGYITQMGKYDAAPAGGIIAGIIVRALLTMISTTLRISVGILICMLTLGSQLGRLFGLIIQGCVPASNIYIGGYAMVGAVAFASATTHTISAAVILVEMTGEVDMLLPCLIGAVVACGITKSRSLSLYDQGMVNKGLESFELLMQHTSGFNIAGDVMDHRACSVTNFCTISDLLTLLRSDKQQIFPVVDDLDTCKLVGSVSRRDVFLFLKSRFDEQGQQEYIRTTLPVDSMLEDQFNLRQKKLEARRAWMSGEFADPSGQEGEGHIRRGLFPSPYQLRFLQKDEEGNPIEMQAKIQAVYSALHTAAVKYTQNATGGADTAAGAAAGTETDSAAPTVTSEEARKNAELCEFLLQCAVEISAEVQLPINLSPFTAHRSTSLDQLYVLFEMVKVSCVFVVREDKTLEGMISKERLLHSLRKKVL